MKKALTYLMYVVGAGLSACSVLYYTAAAAAVYEKKGGEKEEGR